MVFKNSKWRNLVVLMLFLFVLVLFMEIIPRAGGLIDLIWEKVENENKIGRIAEVDSELTEINSENKILKSRIGSLMTDYEEERQLYGILSTLEQVTIDSDCKITSIKPSGIDKKDDLWVQTIDLKVRGDYEKLYNFIRFVENSSKVMLVESLDIKPAKGEENNLDMSLTMEVYLNL